MPMPHRTFAEVAKRRLVGKEGSARVAAIHVVPPAAVKAAPDAPERRIVRANRLALKPMSPEEAVLKIEASRREFLVFRDSRTEKISVLYKRHDGNFGLIEC